MNNNFKNALRMYMKKYGKALISAGFSVSDVFEAKDYDVHLSLTGASFEVIDKGTTIQVGIPLKDVKVGQINPNTKEGQDVTENDLTIELTPEMARYSKTHLILYSFDMAKSKVNLYFIRGTKKFTTGSFVNSALSPASFMDTLNSLGSLPSNDRFPYKKYLNVLNGGDVLI